MTRDEFEVWMGDLCAAFPWVPGYVAKGKDPSGTAEHWFELLAAYDVEDALLATKWMLAGKADEVPKFAEHTLPRHVEGIIKTIRFRRAHPEQAPAPSLPAAPGRPWSTAGVFGALHDCIASGGDVEALAAKLIPVDPEEGPRYRCLFCLDRGMVTCWSTHSMALARRGRLVAGGRGRYSVAVVCSCVAGDRYVPEGRMVPRFNEREWLPVGSMNAAAVAELVAFMAEYVPAGGQRDFVY